MLEPLVRNWPLKLLALLLAFAIWVAVTGENRIVQDYRIPLEITLAGGLVPGEAPPTTVNVRLRGPETIFRRLDPLPMKINVDLRDAAPGPRNVLLSADDVSGVPDGAEVALVEPDRFRLLLERRVKRLLPVVPAFAGQPAKGFTVYDVRLDPESLEVEGPDSKVSVLTRLRTDPIRLDGKTAPFTVRVGVVPATAEVRVADPRPLEAEVIVDLSPVTAILAAVPVVLAGKVYEGYAVPGALSVTLAGPPGLLRGLRSDRLRAVVDVEGLAPRSEPYHLPVRVEFLSMPAAELGRVTVKSLSRPKVAVHLSSRRISP